MTEKQFFVKDFCVYESGNKIGMTLRDCCNRLNELSEENEQLKQTIETICKDYENHHGMDIRNAEWFSAW